MSKEIQKRTISEIWSDAYDNMHKGVFNYKTVKSIPSEWVEENILLTGSVSRFSGKFSYNLSPYMRELIDILHPSNPVRVTSLMKGAQSGGTQGLVVPGMAWIISEHASSILFTAGDQDLAKKTIEQRFDPIMQSSGLKDLIRSNVVRAQGQRSGDTSKSKEFLGGNMIIEGTNNASKFRFFSVKTVFIDDFDAAPKADKKEGSLRSLIEGRQTSFGNLAKTFYISTPTETSISNIYETYLQGDQRKWNWLCDSCDNWMPMDWQIKLDDGTYAGIVWKLDDKLKLIEDSVHYKCPHCGNLIDEKDKYKLNLNGKWIATAEPNDKYMRSYSMNSLIIPPGFIGWNKLVSEWLEAVPPNGQININKLKTFNNIRLGLPFEERGKSPNIMRIMENTSDYDIGVVPNLTCEADGNGKIALISMSVDLGGIMNNDIEDVRLDWEILAHTSNGSSYSIDHGSIGTFKRGRSKTQSEKNDDMSREKLTYMHGQINSAWDKLEEIIRTDLIDESGDLYNIAITLIDTGHFTKHAYEFVNKFIGTGINVYGIKGSAETSFRKLAKDTQPVKKSTERPSLYLLQVSQLKDELSQNMQLRKSDDGTQLPGFMNFPVPSNGKYSVKGFFKHYESEERKEEKLNGEVVGYSWKKKQSSIENHFFDVRVYNIAAKYIWLDLIKRSDPTKYKNLDWALFAEYLI